MPKDGILINVSYPHFKRKYDANFSLPRLNLITKVSCISVTADTRPIRQSQSHPWRPTNFSSAGRK